MVSSNRKMLYPYQPGQGYTFTFYIPWSQIYPPPPPPPLPPPPQQRDLTALFATLVYITAAVLLFTFLTVFLYLYITNSRRRSSPAAVAPTNRREEDENGGERDFSGDHHHFWRIATPGLHRSAIDSIAVFGFKKGEGIIINGTDCSVCLSEFEEDEELRLLPKCSHAFHVNCIDMWLLSHKNCPLCRAPVFSTEPRNQKTETNHHQTESGTNNGDEEESSGLRNANVLLPRSQSDLASRCGGAGGRVETVRRSFSIGGSSLVKDDVGGRSRRQFYSSFSASFFSSSRNQESVLPTRMPSASG